jgi:serine/threonine protein phosphatase PrpC
MTPNGERTMAYVAARIVQQAVRNTITTNPDNFAKPLDDIRDTLQKSFEKSYSEIKAEAPTSLIRGKMIKEFPTTFSSTVVQETESTKEIMLFWAGDSPIFIFTPEAIFTTFIPGSGDAPVDRCITKGNYELKSKQLSFSKNTPVLVVSASDGILKLNGDSLNSALNFILNNIKNNPLDEISQSLTNQYQQLKQNGDVELDDTTIAITLSLKPEEISKLNTSVPIKTIF